MKSSGKSLALRWLCASACMATLLLSVPTQAEQRSVLTHHVREAARSGRASLINSLPATQRLPLTLTLPLRNEAALDALQKTLYDPTSPQYRHFLTVEEFTEQFGPAQEDYDSVVHFAEANGMTVTGTSANRLVVEVSAAVADIDRAFHVTLGVYRHPTENRTFFAPDREPTTDLAVPLWHIGGLDNYSIPHPLFQKGVANPSTRTPIRQATTGTGPGGLFLGSDRRAAYYGGTALTGSGQSVGLFELGGYTLGDVQAYFRNIGQPLNVPINNVLLLGASAGSDGDDTEQVIDIDEAISMAPALSQVRVYIAPNAGFSSGTGDVAIFNSMATENIAKQLSVSWGWTPADPSSNDPIFKEFAVQGQSVFVASGDSNAYSAGSFAYPAEDALVTAVGGTDLVTSGPGGSWVSETAWGGTTGTACLEFDTGSGGGPSPDGIAIPNYQKIAGVINSLNRGSTTLRNVPDLAAEANCDNYYCADGACWVSGQQPLGGTSLAAPTWAGFMALVNQQAVIYGQGPVGFLNAPIYDEISRVGYSTELHDITSGNNDTPGTSLGYNAVAGYDLVTGWGSPAGVNLINALALGGQCGLSGSLYAGPGRVVKSGGGLTSCDGRFTLTMQSTDGNLVLTWNGHGQLWSAGTAGHPGAWAMMQDDGNFVVYTAARTALWATNTGGGTNAGAYLLVQGDGNLVVYSPGGAALWASGTGGH